MHAPNAADPQDWAHGFRTCLLTLRTQLGLCAIPSRITIMILDPAMSKYAICMHDGLDVNTRVLVHFSGKLAPLHRHRSGFLEAYLNTSRPKLPSSQSTSTVRSIYSTTVLLPKVLPPPHPPHHYSTSVNASVCCLDVHNQTSGRPLHSNDWRLGPDPDWRASSRTEYRSRKLAALQYSSRG